MKAERQAGPVTQGLADHSEGLRWSSRNTEPRAAVELEGRPREDVERRYVTCDV